MTAHALSGGVANRGHVFRVGDTVHRPLVPHRAARHALLVHLERAGFAGSPRLLAVDEKEEILSWIPGSAAFTPLPPWALTDTALTSVATLIRRLHDAVADFDAAPYAWPADQVPAGYRSGLVSHNDLHPGNFVFDGERAVGILDFDLAGPGGAVWDLAALARCFCPLLADEDVAVDVRARRLERFALLLDAYGLARRQRVEVARALLANQEWTYRIVTVNAAAGHDGFQQFWDVVRERVQRAHSWITQHQDALERAVS